MIRILICDDHRVLTDALVMVVEADRELEMVAPPVHSTQEALEICRRSPPDVVLMDVSFEGGPSGLEATRQIRDACPSTSVVIMTAHHDERLLVDAVEAGAAAYLSKTEGVDAVLSAAKSAARGEVLFDARDLALAIARVSRERESGRTAQRLLDSLTDREREILDLLTEGLRNEELAARLFISPFTVQTHVSNILGKLGVRSKAEAVAFALKHAPR
jgi:DNA-binding NarL/FixJ family response regulator